MGSLDPAYIEQEHTKQITNVLDFKQKEMERPWPN